MVELRDTPYARELARAVLEYDGGEMRIERLHIKASGLEEIRFSWWPGGQMAKRPLDLPEAELLALLERAIEQNVFTQAFLHGLRALLNRGSE